jgi:hypothetical protein
MAFPATLTPTLKTDWSNTTPVEDTHPDEHNSVAADVEALKTKVGINSSADTNSLDYKLKNSGSISPGHKHTSADITDLPTAVKATASVYGNTRLTQDPAAADTPIAVGANTSLSGTAISTSNKAVDEASVSNAGASDKIVKLNGTTYPPGSAANLTNLPADEHLLKSFTFGETISAGNSLYVKQYPAAAVTFDAKATANTGSSSSFPTVFTVGNNSNRILLVACACSSAQTITGVTYNGVAMTALLSNTGNDSAYTYSLYYLLAPATGANNVIVNTSAATAILVNISSYYNVEQVAPSLTANASGSNNSAVTGSLAPSTSRAFIFSMFSTSRTTGNQAGTAYASNINSQSGLKSGDSGEVVAISAKTGTFTADNSGFISNVWLYALAAVSSGSSARVFKASAAQAATSDTFIGFAYEAGVAGDSKRATISGCNASQSGLTKDSRYYLSDTAGAISTTAGTVTRKVGQAVSATEILVTNIW